MIVNRLAAAPITGSQAEVLPVMKLFFALSLTGIVAVSGFQLPKVVEHRNGE